MYVRTYLCSHKLLGTLRGKVRTRLSSEAHRLNRVGRRYLQYGGVIYWVIELHVHVMPYSVLNTVSWQEKSCRSKYCKYDKMFELLLHLRFLQARTVLGAEMVMTVLHCTTLYCTALYCSTHHCTPQYSIIRYYTDRPQTSSTVYAPRLSLSLTHLSCSGIHPLAVSSKMGATTETLGYLPR